MQVCITFFVLVNIKHVVQRQPKFALIFTGAVVSDNVEGTNFSNTTTGSWEFCTVSTRW